MAAKNWKELNEYFLNKENVLIWFSERDINLYSERTKGCLHLSKFKWVDGWLFYSVKGEHDGWESISKTEPHHIDVCYTHRKDGSSIEVFEPYSSFRGTFKDIQEYIKKLEAKNAEREAYELEEKKKKVAENQERIKSLNIGDILEEGYNDNIKFWQIVEKNDTSLVVALLNRNGDYQDDKAFYFSYYAIKDDFAESDIKETLTAKSFIPWLWKFDGVIPDRNRRSA
ncbi:MAG: hypothetical protein A2W82_08165 [Sulfurimonas sp. RIFCSPLOWO2_12_36_12]|uniref:hypothetical protein n=1 Tax=Sulfurimonas sp. RIFCSPLOWO2_12_36_12 TaxID=1802253 RepID=UPI0008AEB6DB|nr:hypothetical protein [Sulfurimonas sp. RIFCSPLOWO2_12_36_12]OHD99641.1 MAG: hypothetical protein A3J26_07955 [Sulfurimonas sp. RIFCSPLOWO2_02_FULL_36_28]OHE03029.1 MAG: hypothetical protein A2W82_08165 [Sulfurimonas sp. RIFCSPLOWO2_12_36_12]